MAHVREDIIVVAPVVAGTQCAHHLHFQAVLVVKILMEEQVERGCEGFVGGNAVVVVFPLFGIYGMRYGSTLVSVGSHGECRRKQCLRTWAEIVLQPDGMVLIIERIAVMFLKVDLEVVANKTFSHIIVYLLIVSP